MNIVVVIVQYNLIEKKQEIVNLHKDQYKIKLLNDFLYKFITKYEKFKR